MTIFTGTPGRRADIAGNFVQSPIPEAPMSEESFIKSIEDEGLEVFTEESMQSFMKAVVDGGDEDDFEKAKKDISKLVKKQIVTKNGVRKTVYVRPGEVQKDHSHPSDEHAAAHSTYHAKKKYMSKDKAYEHTVRHHGKEMADYARSGDAKKEVARAKKPDAFDKDGKPTPEAMKDMKDKADKEIKSGKSVDVRGMISSQDNDKGEWTLRHIDLPVGTKVDWAVSERGRGTRSMSGVVSAKGIVTVPGAKKDAEKGGADDAKRLSTTGFSMGDSVMAKKDADMPTSLQGVSGKVVGTADGTTSVPSFLKIDTGNGIKEVNPNYFQKQGEKKKDEATVGMVNPRKIKKGDVIKSKGREFVIVEDPIMQRTGNMKFTAISKESAANHTAGSAKSYTTITTRKDKSGDTQDIERTGNMGDVSKLTESVSGVRQSISDKTNARIEAIKSNWDSKSGKWYVEHEGKKLFAGDTVNVKFSNGTFPMTLGGSGGKIVTDKGKVYIKRGSGGKARSVPFSAIVGKS